MIEVLYSDAHIVVCLKPTGVISQDGGEGAMPQLLKQQLQVKEVAFRSGWSNYSIFARIFRQRFGCTPLEMRRFGGADHRRD